MAAEAMIFANAIFPFGLSLSKPHTSFEEKRSPSTSSGRTDDREGLSSLRQTFRFHRAECAAGRDVAPFDTFGDVVELPGEQMPDEG